MNNYFGNIIGYDYVKEELTMILDVMKNQEKYSKLGAKIPKNVLLHGVPGVGKTLFANEFIKASERKSYVIRKDKSNGDFVDFIKKIFEEAKKNEPSIILLDDLDKFANGDANHLNCEEYITVQSCIDDARQHDVFVFATANLLENLPSSLHRNGRFDKKIEVMVAKGESSRAIIKHYLKDKHIESNESIDIILKLLEGRSCANIETIINNAAVLAGFENRENINILDIAKTIIKERFGQCKVDPNISEENKRIVACHEAGHVIANDILFPNTLNIVSLYSNYVTEGVTMTERGDNLKYDIGFYKKLCIVALSGKAAIEVIYGNNDVGCNGDIHDAYRTAERIVDNFVAYGFDKFERQKSSNELYVRKENAIYHELEKCYFEAKKILMENREFLNKVADELLKKKLLLYTDIDKIKTEIKKKV